ncbi:ABC1 kinase family protein [Mycobacteroides franklinii]|uniref:AarF/ABC1/UbiB kinase family protein n=1 Tax=Mycobacteroides franklinii TaxID=948102 RepID=A0A4V3A6M3_9MYCO|nr:AarF/ABC1/UbiB kinase family protein [Mycobacteroides franklinii]ORA59316.1 ABC transporter [Mycobacteroides franklinii]TDH24423.1 AarF/ABC1/UbiB kinase family protein [Mycobacteroides franklinii]
MTDGQVPRGRIRRTMPLAGFTARAAGGRLVAGLREKAGDTGAVDRFHEKTAERYTELLGHSKGVLMKAGQIFSTLDTSLSGSLTPYARALTRLQTQSPPMDSSLARRVLEDDLNLCLGELFADFDDEPISSASIGQVHRATLHDGRDVVVKIQYPGVAQAIRDDLANTELLATFLRVALSATGIDSQADLRGIAAEIADRISEELDYRNEAANIRAFGDLYRDHPFIRVPDLVDEASGDQVLTMTFVDGMGWSEAQGANRELKDTWAEALWRFVYGSFQHSSLYHADPHPGNYRFGLDGSIGVVDFGCVKEFQEFGRYGWTLMGQAMFQDDRRGLRRLAVQYGVLPADSKASADAVHHWITSFSPGLSLAQPVRYTPELMEEFLAAVNISNPNAGSRHLTIPPEMFMLSRITMGVTSSMTTLGATVNLRAILSDMAGVDEPSTPLGIQHVAWVRERGLPFGLEPRDQPKVGARL